MGSLWLDLLPVALFWLFSPAVICVVILLLSTSKAVKTTLAFCLPVILGCMLAGVYLYYAYQEKDYSPGSSASGFVAVAQLICAAVFFLVVLLVLWKVPKGAPGMKMPKWVEYIDEVTPRKALLFGSILFFNYVFLTITAVTDTLHAQVSMAAGCLTIILFVMVGTLGMWVPLSYKIFAPEERSTARFESLRVWLIQHNRAILAFEFGFLGAITLAKGLKGLLA